MGFKSIFKKVVIIILINTVLVFNASYIFNNVSATDAAEMVPTNTPLVGFMMSPMNNRLNLNPGESYTGEFYLTNPENNVVSIKYTLEVRSFYRDENGGALFEDVDGRGQMANWITLNVPNSGTIAPGVVNKISYTINVPANPPAGGQYASIVATSSTDGDAEHDAAALKESIAMAYTIFAEIAGETIHSGEIADLNVPGFLFDGNLTATSNVKNTGNIHDTATYTIDVYSLFSDHPIYSNQDQPDKKLILPDRSVSYSTSWEDTPTIGIFNVSYKVEFAGDVKELKKLFIKCPVWLFMIFIIIAVAIVFYIIFKIKRIRDNKHRTKTSTQANE